MNLKEKLRDRQKIGNFGEKNLWKVKNKLNPYENIIVTDYDGVCVDFDKYFSQYALKSRYKIVTPNSYSLQEKFGLTKKELII